MSMADRHGGALGEIIDAVQLPEDQVDLLADLTFATVTPSAVHSASDSQRSAGNGRPTR